MLTLLKNRNNETNNPLLARVIFVAICIEGRLRPKTHTYLHAWANRGVYIDLILQGDGSFPQTEKIFDLDYPNAQVWVRSNVGYDFGAWAEVLKITGRFDDTAHARTYLVNDSIIGPTSLLQFNDMINMIDNLNIDLIGLTNNHSPINHVQSYFLSFTDIGLKNSIIKDFFYNIENKESISEVVSSYEIPLANVALKAGLSVGVIFPAEGHLDPCIFEADTLLVRGMPFIKRKIFSNVSNLVDKVALTNTIKSISIDGPLLEFLLDSISGGFKHEVQL